MDMRQARREARRTLAGQAQTLADTTGAHTADDLRMIRAYLEIAGWLDPDRVPADRARLAQLDGQLSLLDRADISGADVFEPGTDVAPSPGREVLVLDNGQALANVHEPATCVAPCPVHSPTDHHMRDWPVLWRPDAYLFERTCPHGIGHPDPDQVPYWTLKLGEDDAAARMVHGCDGCCRPPDA
jgi:hypothetical protein